MDALGSRNASSPYARPTPRGDQSPIDKVKERFAPGNGPETVVDLSQGLDTLSPREQDLAVDGRRVFQTVKGHFESLQRADNNSPLDEDPREGHYRSSPSSQPVPTWTVGNRWNETEGAAQRTVESGFVHDEGTEAVTLPGQEKMAVATTYRNENGSRPVAGGMYFYTDGELEKAGMIDRQGKRVEVVASAQGGVLTVMETFQPPPR